VLGISLLLAAPSVGGLKSNFGQRVHGSAEEDSEELVSCFSSMDSLDFDVLKALDHIDACPDRFLKNDQLNVHTTWSDGQSEARFCVGTCPGNACSNAQCWGLWFFFTLPGMCTFLVHASAIVFVTFELGAQKGEDGEPAPHSLGNYGGIVWCSARSIRAAASPVHVRFRSLYAE
jgi:hypothetical protein